MCLSARSGSPDYKAAAVSEPPYTQLNALAISLKITQ